VPAETLELGKSHDTFWSGYTGFFDDFRIYKPRAVRRRNCAVGRRRHSADPGYPRERKHGDVKLVAERASCSRRTATSSNKNGWADVSNGNVSPVMVTIAPTGAKFYRLKKP